MCVCMYVCVWNFCGKPPVWLRSISAVGQKDRIVRRPYLYTDADGYFVRINETDRQAARHQGVALHLPLSTRSA